jgi:membrane-bound acyltransferase YfiQ involved in biofilm formation
MTNKKKNWSLCKALPSTRIYYQEDTLLLVEFTTRRIFLGYFTTSKTWDLDKVRSDKRDVFTSSFIIHFFFYYLLGYYTASKTWDLNRVRSDTLVRFTCCFTCFTAVLLAAAASKTWDLSRVRSDKRDVSMRRAPQDRQHICRKSSK